MALKSLAAKYQPLAIYTLLALAVLLPLLKPGYVLTLDLVFTPDLRMPPNVTSSYLFHAILHFLNLIMPSQILEKVILFAILLLSGVGMHRLVQFIGQRHIKDYLSFSSYFAGLLYMINPFTYDRFMAGQYNVLLGYALLPFFLRALLIFLRAPALRSTLTLAAWAIVISIVSIHTIGMLVILSLVGVGLKLWRIHSREYMRPLVKFGLIGLAIFVIASSYWLIPLIAGKGTTAETISGFSTGDSQAFATGGGNALGKIGNVVRLQGFWAETTGLYRLPQDQVRIWGLIALTVWLLVVLGGVLLWRQKQRFVLLLTSLSAIFAVTLATFGSLTDWLSGHAGLFAGYREPDKFVSLVALAYASFAGFGVAAALRFLANHKLEQWTIFSASLLLLIPLLFTPTMFWGFGGQLKPREYPSGWSVINQRLDKDKSNFQTLFLPWHLYMYYGFAGRIIASPALSYFNKPMLTSNDPEFNGASPTTSDIRQTQLSEHILPQASQGTHLGSRLATIHVKYILLDKDDDYRKYAYLDHQTDVRLLTENANFKLYRNTAFGGQ